MFFHLCSFYVFIISTSQKGFHQDNLSFVCLQFCKRNCLNMLPTNIFFHIEVKKPQKKNQILYHLLARLSHKSQYKRYCHIFLFWFLYICHQRLVKQLVLYFLSLQSQSKQLFTFLIASHHLYGKTVIFVFIFLFFFNFKFLSISTHFRHYPNCFIALCKYPIQ